ncbi:MAG: adenosylmethionine decarboxylase [Deltaproteobacteria bacterium]|nr:adenosylmethionine decarboxylase [Deltaproteobacteria bacterium]
MTATLHSYGKIPDLNEAVELSVIVATLTGCDLKQLDDPEAIAALLSECVNASGMTLIHQYVHKFQPCGVTGAAVLAESHVAIHTWPHQGMLFVDIATCSSMYCAKAAFECICKLVPHTDIRIKDLSLA